MKAVLQWYENPPHFRVAILSEHTEIGFAEFDIAADECQIRDIQIQTVFQRQGHGQKLLQQVLWKAEALHCQKSLLEVRADNVAALALYEKLGFIRTGIRKKYYQDGRDAVLMQLKLKPAV